VGVGVEVFDSVALDDWLAEGDGELLLTEGAGDPPM
jgi:hypothetical protein